MHVRLQPTAASIHAAVALAVAVLLFGCSDAECVTPGCAPLPHDGGTADASSPDGAAMSDAALPCRGWHPSNACVAEGTCPDPSTVRLGLAVVGSARLAEVPLLESVAFIPGEEDRAVGMSAEHLLVEVFYGPGGLRFGARHRLSAERPTQYTTSVKVHPSGRFAAVAVADVDCAPGEVLFVDVADDFGRVVHRVQVGYVPDGLAFSSDGRWLVTADEDERSNRPCKPADRHGGSITVVEVGDDPTAAAVAQTILVDHAPDSEPESVNVGAEGTVVVALQETSEIAVFDLGEVPAAVHRIVSLPANGDPDGVAVDDARGLAVIGLEHTDDIVVVSLATDSIASVIDVVASGDVPDDYNRDVGDSNEIHEPEQIVLTQHEGATFALVPLQESHAVLAYRLRDDGTLIFDSVAPVGVEWMAELGGLGRSRIGPEGIDARVDAGLFLVANERESSLTLLRSAASTYGECP